MLYINIYTHNIIYNIIDIRLYTLYYNIYICAPALFICISDQKWLEIIQQAASVRLT